MFALVNDNHLLIEVCAGKYFPDVFDKESTGKKPRENAFRFQTDCRPVGKWSPDVSRKRWGAELGSHRYNSRLKTKKGVGTNHSTWSGRRLSKGKLRISYQFSYQYQFSYPI